MFTGLKFNNSKCLDDSQMEHVKAISSNIKNNSRAEVILTQKNRVNFDYKIFLLHLTLLQFGQ
jgi:hypothetical protein